MIRPAALEDLEAIVDANAAMALETEDLVLDRSILREGVRAVLEQRVPGFYRVLEQEGRIVAQLMITMEWSDWRNRMVWWIQSVYVAPDARRNGHYRRLYDAVRQEALEAGCGGIRLYVDRRNRRAQETYASLGMNGEHYQVFEAMFAGSAPDSATG